MVDIWMKECAVEIWPFHPWSLFAHKRLMTEKDNEWAALIWSQVCWELASSSGCSTPNTVALKLGVVALCRWKKVVLGDMEVGDSVTEIGVIRSGWRSSKALIIYPSMQQSRAIIHLDYSSRLPALRVFEQCLRINALDVYSTQVFYSRHWAAHPLSIRPSRSQKSGPPQVSVSRDPSSVWVFATPAKDQFRIWWPFHINRTRSMNDPMLKKAAMPNTHPTPTALSHWVTKNGTASPKVKR